LVAGVVIFIAVTSVACAAALNHLQGTPSPEAKAAAAPQTGTAVAAANGPSGAASAGSAEGQPDPRVMVARLAARLQKEPNDLEGWRMLARAYMVMEQPEDALKASRRVVALAPDDADALVDLARVIGYMNRRQINEEAEGLLNKALQKDPNNVLAHALLGKTEMDRGQPGKARAHWQTALAHIDPKHPFAEQLRNAVQAAEQSEADTVALQQISRASSPSGATGSAKPTSGKRP
jgi:cytochrome c-type biogenesis protein CcmH